MGKSNNYTDKIGAFNEPKKLVASKEWDKLSVGDEFFMLMYEGIDVDGLKLEYLNYGKCKATKLPTSSDPKLYYKRWWGDEILEQNFDLSDPFILETYGYMLISDYEKL
jgi:hypothetical protein